MNVSVIANVVIVQCRGCCGNITMDVFAIVNVVMVQRRRYYVNIPKNTSAIVNVTTMQRRRYYVNIPKKPPHITNALTTQLGTSCVFDSPGLARNEPTPGKRLYGDSTPKVLSFFCEGTFTMKPFMAD